MQGDVTFSFFRQEIEYENTMYLCSANISIKADGNKANLKKITDAKASNDNGKTWKKMPTEIQNLLVEHACNMALKDPETIPEYETA